MAPDPMDFHDAIVNRHDITMERTGNGGAFIHHHPSIDTLAGELRKMIEAPNVSEEIIVMNPGMNMPDSRIAPAPGIFRQVVIRTANPPANTTIPTTGAILYQDNPNRFGGAVINTGTNPLLLVLGVVIANDTGSPQGGATQAGYGTLWLSANGGSWNMKLTEVIWGGSIFGYGLGGSTTVAGVEI